MWMATDRDHVKGARIRYTQLENQFGSSEQADLLILAIPRCGFLLLVFLKQAVYLFH
jgi:hypothetical protein